MALYFGLKALQTLYNNTNMGSFYNQNATTNFFNPTWRIGDSSTLTYYERTTEILSGAHVDNFRFNRTSDFAAKQNGQNWESTAQTIYQSSTAGGYVELQVVGESVSLYGLTKSGWGTGDVSVDGTVVVSGFNFGATPTTTQTTLGNESAGWDGNSSSDSTSGHFDSGVTTAGRKITVSASAGLTSSFRFGLKTGLTFSSNNPVNIASTGHGLTTGQLIYVTGSTATGSLANGIYTITVVDANNFTVPFNGSGAGGTCAYSIAKDYSSVDVDDYLAVDYYLDTPANVSYLNVLFDFSNVTGNPTDWASINVTGNFKTNTLDTFYIRKGDIGATSSDFAGTINWAHVYRCWVKPSANSSGGLNVTFSNLRWVTKTLIYSTSSLSPYFDHTLRVTVDSGVCTVSSAVITASKLALEMHRDQIPMCAPTLAVTGVVQGDTTMITRAQAMMDYYYNSVVVGDRTKSNRSRYGSVGVGGTESAQGGSDPLEPGVPTTTDSAFDLVMMNLAYAVLKKSGNATPTQLSNWLTMITGLADYAYNRGYVSSNYFNVGNSQLAWATGLALTWRNTGIQKYRGYAVTMANAMMQGASLLSNLIWFFEGKWSDARDASLITSIRGYIEEVTGSNLGTTTIGANMTATQTTVNIPSTTNISGVTSNFWAMIGNEMIYVQSLVSGSTYNCLRGQLGSTATTHSNGDTIYRTFDPGYLRVQCNFAYAYGVIMDDVEFQNLGKVLFNAHADLLNVSNFTVAIGGGSRNYTIQDSSALSTLGFVLQTIANNDVYPALSTGTTMLNKLTSIIDTYGYVYEEDPVIYGTSAFNYIYSFFDVAYAMGMVNSLIYLGYLPGNMNGQNEFIDQVRL